MRSENGRVRVIQDASVGDGLQAASTHYFKQDTNNADRQHTTNTSIIVPFYSSYRYGAFREQSAVYPVYDVPGVYLQCLRYPTCLLLQKSRILTPSNVSLRMVCSAKGVKRVCQACLALINPIGSALYRNLLRSTINVTNFKCFVPTTGLHS